MHGAAEVLKLREQAIKPGRGIDGHSVPCNAGSTVQPACVLPGNPSALLSFTSFPALPGQGRRRNSCGGRQPVFNATGKRDFAITMDKLMPGLSVEMRT